MRGATAMSDSPTSSQPKPPGQSWESFAERRVRDAIEAGDFQNLPGFGKPIPDIDEPWDENSWVRKKLKAEEVRALPPILEARLRIERFLQELAAIPTEYEVRRRLVELNEFVRSAHFSHIAGPADGVRPLDESVVLADWRRRRSPSPSLSEAGAVVAGPLAEVEK